MKITGETIPNSTRAPARQRFGSDDPAALQARPSAETRAQKFAVGGCLRRSVPATRRSATVGLAQKPARVLATARDRFTSRPGRAALSGMPINRQSQAFCFAPWSRAFRTRPSQPLMTTIDMVAQDPARRQTGAVPCHPSHRAKDRGPSYRRALSPGPIAANSKDGSDQAVSSRASPRSCRQSSVARDHRRPPAAAPAVCLSSGEISHHAISMFEASKPDLANSVFPIFSAMPRLCLQPLAAYRCGDAMRDG